MRRRDGGEEIRAAAGHDETVARSHSCVELRHRGNPGRVRDLVEAVEYRHDEPAVDQRAEPAGDRTRFGGSGERRVAEGQLTGQPAIRTRHCGIPGRRGNQHGHRVSAPPAPQQIQHEAQQQNRLAGSRLAEHHQPAGWHSGQDVSQPAALPGQVVRTGRPGGVGLWPSAAFRQRHQGRPPVYERRIGRLPADR